MLMQVVHLFVPFIFRVWSVRYNHFHDQLVLSSSSDSRVILNNVVSLSSEPYGHLVENDEDSDEEQENRYSYTLYIQHYTVNLQYLKVEVCLKLMILRSENLL